jgi:serine/threonine protein kinase
MSQLTTIGGTLSFMPPELRFQSTRLSTRPFAADMWSYGETIYRMLAGQPMFDGDALLDYWQGRASFSEEALRRLKISNAAIEFIKKLVVPESERGCRRRRQCMIPGSMRLPHNRNNLNLLQKTKRFLSAHYLCLMKTQIQLPLQHTLMFGQMNLQTRQHSCDRQPILISGLIRAPRTQPLIQSLLIHRTNLIYLELTPPRRAVWPLRYQPVAVQSTRPQIQVYPEPTIIH